MLVFIAGLAAAFFVFRALGAQRAGGILRRAFWCCYVLWAVLAVYIASGHQDLKVAAVMLVGPLVLYGMVVFIVRGWAAQRQLSPPTYPFRERRP